MSRSQAQKQWPCEPERCEHPEDQLRMRGNQAQYWWVCLSCGSRWERTEAAVAVAGQGAVPERVKPIYRSTAPPKLLPPPRSRNDLGTLTLEQARMAPATSASTTPPKPCSAYPDKTSLRKNTPKVNTGAKEYPDVMFTKEPDYGNQKELEADKSQGSNSMRALALFQPGSPVKDLERVDARSLRTTTPTEWADYNDLELRTAGPMRAMTPRRSRSLPAGVNPIQERTRRRQVHLQEMPTELYAINDSDQEERMDKTPSSFAMVEPEEQDEL